MHMGTAGGDRRLSDLRTTVTALFNTRLDPAAHSALDRVHRVSTPRAITAEGTRDVV